MPINKFTTLQDLARQAKILSGETATFDGKIQAGIPFSGYPTGVDTGTTVSLGVVSSENAVFSGNTGTTIFDVSNTGSTNYSPIFSGYTASTWSNPLFSGNTSGLTLPITPLSADTQIVGPFWTLTQTGMTGDYVIGTQYTGYSVTYSFFNLSQIGTGFTYSGFTTASQENFSAGTLDYKGPLDYISTKEDASVEGRLTTNKITITNGASASTIGYVLTQTGENGEAEWVINASADTNTYVTGGTLTLPSAGSNLILGWNTGGSANPIDLSSLEFTGNTSGDCINDIYVKNIHSCSPLFVNPNDEGNVYIGSNSGFTYDTLNSSLLIKGDVIAQSDSLVLSSLTGLESKGMVKYFSHTGNTVDANYNPNISGSSQVVVGPNFSSGSNFSLGYYGKSYTRDYVGFTGSEFWRGKGVIRTNSSLSGTVFSNNSKVSWWWESMGTSRMKLTSDGYLGLGLSDDGIEDPILPLHVKGNILVQNTNGNLYTDIQNSVGPLVLLSGGTSNLPRFGVISPSSDSITMGVRGSSDVSYPGYGNQGDSFIYSSNPNNGINIISSQGTGTDDYIRFYAGQDANGTTPDLYIQGSGATRGYVGINTDSPTNYLDIDNSLSGFKGLRVRRSYTPSSSGDTNGEVGTITWDNNYIYVKTGSGWGRAQLDFTF